MGIGEGGESSGSRRYYNGDISLRHAGTARPDGSSDACDERGGCKYLQHLFRLYDRKLTGGICLGARYRGAGLCRCSDVECSLRLIPLG